MSAAVVRCAPSCAARRRARGLALLALVLAAGCSSVPRGGYYQDDGPPERALDPAAVPDAEPRAEALSRHGNAPYTVFGVRYTPRASADGYRERGIASWYGRKFHGRRTSSGEPYDMYAMSAAHRTLPLPSYVRVRNLENDRAVVVRVNDRGPFLHDRLIDLSYAAAARLGMLGTGTALVEVEAVGPETSGAGADTDAGAPRLAVQVGAFRRYEHAAALRARLDAAGFAPVYIAPEDPATAAADALYRVRIGPVAGVAQGDRLVSALARHGIHDARLVVD